MLARAVVLVVLSLAAGCAKESAPPGPATRSEAKPAAAVTDDDLRQAARSRVRQGYESTDEMVEYLVLMHSLDAAGKARARRMVGDEMARHRTEEATWDGMTDCDRLDAAFAVLDRAGILAAQVPLGPTDGHMEMAFRAHDAEKRGRTLRGYVFFGDDALESAADGEGLYLAFAARTDDRQATTEVAGTAVDALRAKGLTVTWNGDPDRKIFVELEWRKRRFTKAPAQ